MKNPGDIAKLSQAYLQGHALSAPLQRLALLLCLRVLSEQELGAVALPLFYGLHDVVMLAVRIEQQVEHAVFAG